MTDEPNNVVAMKPRKRALPSEMVAHIEALFAAIDAYLAERRAKVEAALMDYIDRHYGEMPFTRSELEARSKADPEGDDPVLMATYEVHNVDDILEEHLDLFDFQGHFDSSNLVGTSEDVRAASAELQMPFLRALTPSNPTELRRAEYEAKLAALEAKKAAFEAKCEKLAAERAEVERDPVKIRWLDDQPVKLRGPHQ